MREIISGIYCIENVVNNKKYIGQSCNIYTRWENHRWLLNNNKHENSYLQRSWDKYGEDSFIFYIIEKCNQNIIDERERYYISYYKTTIDKNGYNLDSGGNKNKRHSQETKNKISKSNTGKINREETRKKISQNRKGKCTGEQNYNWGRKPCEKVLLAFAKQRESNHGSNNYCARKVICINTGEIFNTIDAAAEKYNLFATNVGKCCLGKRRYCGKFNDGTPIQWAYYHENTEYSLNSEVLEYHGNQKEVAQYDEKMNLIAIFKSAREAERITGISYKYISRVCLGERKSTCGYIFKFI